jgi:hypothetical protein
LKRVIGILVVLVAVAVSWLPRPAGAHDIPSDVVIQAFVKPEGRQLYFLLRVPLPAMQDMTVPTRDQGYVDLARVDKVLRDAVDIWIVDSLKVYEGETLLPEPDLIATRVSLPSDRSFADYQTALAHVTGEPLPEDTELYWEQGMLDVLLSYPIESDASDFSIHPGFDRLGLRVTNVIRFLPPSGVVRAFEFPAGPDLVRLDPRWHQAAFRFVELGFFHILDGIDHLLFLFCLIIPFRRFRPLVLVVTSFTIAHSITLIASALGLAPDALWFPPFVEMLIALSIVYMALENVIGAKVERRWMIAFGFGLVHGLGFSFALRQTLQFAGSHLLTSLVAFNVGVELGQLLVLALVIPILSLVFRYAIAERVGIIVLSVFVAHTGWHWMLERGAILSQFSWPELDAALLASVLRWLMLLVLIAGALWLISVLRRPTERGQEDKAQVGLE